MKISEMSEDDAKQHLYDSYMGAHAAYAGDDPVAGPHPSRDVSRWRAAAAGAPVEGQIQKGQDDDQPEKSANGNGGNGGNTPAQDFALAEARLRQSGSANLEGDLWALRARQTDPRKVRAVAAAIPGYDRLK